MSTTLSIPFNFNFKTYPLQRNFIRNTKFQLVFYDLCEAKAFGKYNAEFVVLSRKKEGKKKEREGEQDEKITHKMNST